MTDRPMWKCPKCFRPFTRPDQSHSCGPFSVARFLEGKSAQAVQLYRRFEELVTGVGDVLLALAKTRIGFQNRRVFAAVNRIGVDTPETVHPGQPVQCYGPETSAFTKAVLPPGAEVQLEFDAEQRDRYDRLLAYVWLNETQMLNMALVAQGYAKPLAIRPNTRYARQFEQLANEAQREGAELWGVCP